MLVRGYAVHKAEQICYYKSREYAYAAWAKYVCRKERDAVTPL